jgi:hypothetical protein
MKDTLIKKLTIIIEATNYKSISNDVMKTIYDLEKSIAPNPEVKLSLVALNEKNKAEIKNADFISPENWDYWQV